MKSLQIDPHPLLDAGLLLADLPAPLGDMTTPSAISALFGADVVPAVGLPDGAKTAVRDLLRHGGFKPAGRSKPASEYLIKARDNGWLSPDRSINPVVDALNAVSLHSGLPISIVDVDLARPPWRLAVCESDADYVFNPSGQVIGLEGLLCLHDADGPCANAVKDSQRTKTHDGTRRTLSVVWGTHALPGHTAAVVEWYQRLLQSLGAEIPALDG